MTTTLLAERADVLADADTVKADTVKADTVIDLWSAYRAAPNAATRNELVRHYAGLVTLVAARLHATLPSSVDYRDLVQSGVFGLIHAVERFEPERGLRFETFAAARIRGAMLDELRALDWAPRSVRRNARQLTEATERLQGRLNREPTSGEMCAELALDGATLRNARAQSSLASVGALDELLARPGTREGIPLAETLADPLAERPGEAAEERAVHAALRAGLAELPERSRLVLVRTYVDGLTLVEVGQVLGVTESRACQLRSRALSELRSKVLARLEG